MSRADNRASALSEAITDDPGSPSEDPDLLAVQPTIALGTELADIRLPPGQAFRGLTVHCELGAGGMGVAHLASHPVLRTPLLIKTFPAKPVRGIFSEAHLAARVSSPHVVPVHDAGFEHGIPFVVQRYVDGLDLGELLGWCHRSKRRLPVDVVCRILVDAARGLHAIHQTGVIHRDIKPFNLFLGGAGNAFVGDFGIALDVHTATVGTEPVGTPQFMAPEQWLGRKLDRRVDIYALGATGHLLATGKVPFPGADAAEMARQHLQAPYLPPAASSPAEAYLFAVIARMLEKDPSRRHQNADAVARDLSPISRPRPRARWVGPDHALLGPSDRDRDEIDLRLLVDDIAGANADVIVNAANSDLKMEFGVAGALRKAAGDALETAARAHAPAAMGQVIWTPAAPLKAEWVAHAVSATEDGAICIQRCILRTLLEADRRGAHAVAIPALGTGVGGVPMELGAKLATEAFDTFASLRPRHVRRIQVYLLDELARARWRDILYASSALHGHEERP